MSTEKRVALVTGGNRGLGLETCRQLGNLGYRVILTSRSDGEGQAAAERLRDGGLDVLHHRLDVTEPGQIAEIGAWLSDDSGRIDALVNNAGIFLENKGYPDIMSALEVDLDIVRRTLETNTFGHMLLCQTVIPLMRSRNYGRIVNVTSTMGQLSDTEARAGSGGAAAYRLSHVCNNALAHIFAAELEGTNVLINAAHPGWVRTDMGGPDAPVGVETGVETAVWLATLPDGGPTGGFFHGTRQLGW